MDSAEAITYRRARVTSRRVARRDYRYTRRAVRRGAVYGTAYRPHLSDPRSPDSLRWVWSQFQKSWSAWKAWAKLDEVPNPA